MGYCSRETGEHHHRWRSALPLGNAQIGSVYGRKYGVIGKLWGEHLMAHTTHLRV